MNSPFIDSNEFKNQICYLAKNNEDISPWAWMRALRQKDEDTLQITRLIRSPNSPEEFLSSDELGATEESKGEATDGDEDDFEDEIIEKNEGHLIVLESKPHKDNLEVQYTVMLSQSYQVPMLYITITNRASQPILNLDSFYELLIPSSRREELQKEGVFGSISLTNHPSTGIPCFFIHPCQTADALRSLEVGSGKADYLLAWFGLVGPAVGLYVPKALAVRCHNS